MAQTRRKRQTKHRGNAGGVVESRGRTGRPPSAEEKKRTDRDRRREERLSRKPSWKGSVQRALLVGGFMFVFLLLTDRPKHGSAVLAAVLFAMVSMVLYLMFGYWLEMFLWRRRMAKKQVSVPRR